MGFWFATIEFNLLLFLPSSSFSSPPPFPHISLFSPPPLPSSFSSSAPPPRLSLRSKGTQQRPRKQAPQHPHPTFSASPRKHPNATKPPRGLQGKPKDRGRRDGIRTAISKILLVIALHSILSSLRSFCPSLQPSFAPCTASLTSDFKSFLKFFRVGHRGLSGFAGGPLGRAL